MKQFTKTVSIAKTWRGELVKPEETVNLTLECGMEFLRFEIDAPFYDHQPPPADPGFFDGLWNYDVVEVFLVGSFGGYIEVEFGPHGHYLGYVLDGPRSVVGRFNLEHYETDIRNDRWLGHGTLNLKHLPEKIVQWNAFAIFGESPQRTYMCMGRLPGETPNFHQPAHFPVWDGPS